MKPALVRALLFGAFFLSGMAGLVYEVLWSKYLALFLGGTSLAHTIVLATFMAGLAAGNAWFGRRADHALRRSLRLYASLELGIGAFCLLFPTIFSGLSATYLAVARQAGLGAAAGMALKVSLAAGTMFVPCVLMGGTLPLLARYVVDRLSRVGVQVSVLYFVNTAGAVLGCALGGFYVVEHWGLDLGMVATSLVNIAIGGVAYWIARAPGAELESPPHETAAAVDEPPYSPLQARVAFGAIAAAGGLTMLYELVWIRLLGLSMGGTTHAFSIMLISFVSGIALGSFLVGRLFRQPQNALVLFAMAELGIAVFVLLALPWYERLPFFFYRVGSLFSHAPRAYPVFLLAEVATAFWVMVLPTTLMGAALPLASRVCVDRMLTLGRRIGNVFSVNTVGTVVGAVLTGFVLLPRLGLERSLFAGATGSALLALALLESWRRGLAGAARARASRVLVAFALLVGLLFVRSATGPGWDARLTQFGLWRWERSFDFTSFEGFRESRARVNVLYAKDGADASILVEDSGNRVLRVNGKPDATSGADMRTQLMVGHLGMLLHADPREAMVVGLASGASAGAMLRHAGAHVDVAEISAPMLEAAAFFDSVNDGVLKNPRARIFIADARESLMLSPKRYDVIVSEPTNVWVPGVATLFTQDFYRVVKERLRPGGLFVQWLPIYSSDSRIVDSVGATLRSVFPWTSVWLLEDADLIVVAGDAAPAFDPASFARRLAAVQPGPALQNTLPGLRVFSDPVLLLGTQIATSEAAAIQWPRGSAPVYRDLFPQMEFQAARAQFGAQPYRIREELDERLRPLTSAPLFLERYLAGQDLTPSRQRALAASFDGLGTSCALLARSLALTPMANGDDDDEGRLALAPTEAAHVLLALGLAGAVDRAPSPSRPACDAYLTAQARSLKEVSSILARPDPAPIVKRVEACAVAHPSEALHYETDLVRALYAAGYLEPTLDRLLALRERGAFSHLAASDAAALAAAGASLLLRAERPEEALQWAREAYRLSPAELDAVRLIWALSGQGPRNPSATGSGG